MSEATLPSAALTAGFEQYRPFLTGHCYRMLGSVVDAEDAVQEAMLRAWKGVGQFREQSSMKTWLYKIATNVCLDTLSASERRRFRALDTSDTPAVVDDDLVNRLTKQPREHWVEPIPDVMALPAESDSDPAERALLRESIRLAFVAALQYLPPRQRAVLLLTQVLSFSATEAAETLGMSVAAVNSALQRARATLDARNPAVVPRVLSEEQTRLVARYMEAFEQYDIVALKTLLHEEASHSMPPFDLWLRGRDSIATWMAGAGIGCTGSRLIPVQACGETPAFAQYRMGGAQAWALITLDIEDDRIVNVTNFLDVETLFPRFDLPLQLTS